MTMYGTLAESTFWLNKQVEPYRNDSFPTFLKRRNTDSDRLALVFRDHIYSFRQLHEAIEATAQNAILRYSVKPGDRVVMNMDNSDRFIVIYLALHLTGAVAVPINPKLVVREIAVLLSDCKPSLYIADADKVAAAKELANDFDMAVADANEVLQTIKGDAALPQVDPDAPATIFYTSGTTGVPKGVVHTHRTLISGAFQTSKAWGYDNPKAAVLAVTPLFHVAAHSWFYPLLAFDSTIILDSFKTERTFELIEKHRVEGFNAVPAMLLMMVEAKHARNYDLSCVTRVRFGASPMPPDKLAAVQKLFPNAGLYHGMGQTESGGTISVLPPELAFVKNGSTGYAMPACEVRIIGDDGEVVPTGAYGEVLARGPHIMKEYYNRPDATASTLEGGWLHTGDVGYVDAEGCVYLVDRKKDMIIRGGENVYSVEIENVLVKHPAIETCAVIGVPDPIMGEAICAVLVIRQGSYPNLEAELTERCKAELAPFKVPQIWKHLDELPRTATGKIQKAVIRDRVREMVLAEA